MNCSVEYSCLNSKPLVTFVLFAYNQEEFIQEAVRGVFAQDYRPLEIILSDDCSTDRTFEIMQIEAKSAPDDVDLHLVQSPVNLGIASHINRIFEQVNGEYLVIGAGDDISESNRVSLCINELLKFKRMVLHSKAKKISPDGKDLGIEENPYLSILENAEEIVENMAWVTGATAVIHRNIIENFPKLNKNVVNEDMVWAFRSALKGGSVYINQECVRYRVGVGVSTFRGVGDLVLENQNIRVQLFRSLAVLEQMERDLVSTSTKGTFFEQLHALILKKINQKNACVEFSGSPDLWRGVKMLIRSEWSLDVVKLFMRFLLPSLFSALKSWKSHPRIYCFSQRFSVIETIRRLLLESYVKPESLVFMNQACLRAHESCLRLPLTESMVLPVALPTITPRTVKPVPGKIVSVGRLQPFKSYNLYMIDIVNQLVKKGMHNLSWHVYGYGMLEDEMREKVRRFGLQDHIFLHGAVTYADFRSVVEDAHLFIGMGTSLIEAGMIGVPGVPSIDSAGQVSYGYTHDLDGYDVGEQSNVSPNQSVMELIEKIYQMTEEDYKYVEAKTIEHCNRFDIQYVGPEFLRSIDALGLLRKPSRYETALMWMHFVVLTLILCRDIIHGGVVNLAKWTLPRRLIPWARRLNRAWLGRRGFDEMARHCKQETKSGS